MEKTVGRSGEDSVKRANSKKTMEKMEKVFCGPNLGGGG